MFPDYIDMMWTYNSMIFSGKTARWNQYYQLSLKRTDTNLFETYMVCFVPPSRF